MEDNHLPKHVAIIMDGNGRWARQRHLPRTQGHLEGVKRVEEIIAAAQEMGIKVLTLYAFSTENWSRPEDEVSMLMETLINVLNRNITRLCEGNIRFQFIGRRNGIPKKVLETIDSAMELTKNNKVLILNLAFNYGGRLEIIDAVQKIASAVKDSRLRVDEIDEGVISDSLYTQGLPDPDLLIRTSGEKRISNFLLWQLSYAEFYFTDKYWPEFSRDEFQKAILEFKNRERRYGNVEPPKYQHIVNP